MSLIPIMPQLTSNASPSPFVVTTSSQYSDGYAGWKMFDRDINTTADAGWLTQNGSAVNQQWIEINFGGLKSIDQIWFYQYYNSQYRVRVVSIFYSIDGGSNYIPIEENISLDYRAYGSHTIAKYVLPSRISGAKIRVNLVSGGTGSSYTGFNEMQLYTDSTRNSKCIIKDSNNYKTITNGTLEDLGTELPSVAIIEEKGIVDLNMLLQNNIINSISNNFKIISLSNDSVKQTLNLKAIPEPQLLIPTGDINLKLLETLHKIEVRTQGSGGIIKVAVSFDSGKTWKKYSDGLWSDIALDTSTMKTEGISVEQLSVIPKQSWDVAFIDKKIRFAYYLEYDAADQTIAIDNLIFTADMLGTWKRARHGTDYDYEYASNTILKVDVLTDGTYKINYGEFNVEPNGPGSGGSGTGNSNIIPVGIPSTVFERTLDGVYKYRWIHNKNTKHVIFNAIDQDTGDELLMTTKVVDANTIDIFINAAKNVYLTAIM